MNRSVRIACLAALMISIMFLSGFGAFAQTAPDPATPPAAAGTPASPGTQPISTLPPLAYILGIGGLNTGLLALKHYGPKIPAYLVPLLNVGFTLGGFYLGAGQDLASAALNTGIVSGGSTIAHNLTKNIARGDTLGQPSMPIPPGAQR